MKKLLALLPIAGSLLLSPISAQSSIITHYQIDFSSPTHSVGSGPSTGTGTDQVSSVIFGTPTVESSFGSSADQSLHFNANTSTYEQIRLEMGQGYDNYQISFDFYSSNLSESNYAFALLADTPTVRNFYFSGTTGVRYWAPFVDPINGGSFADDTNYHVTLDYDLAVGSVSLWLNSGLLGSRSFTTTGDDIESFRFSLSPAMGGTGLDPSINVNLDNILVTSRTANVPEPSTLLLFSLGLIGLSSARFFSTMRS
ncbi:MAG: PEP-CTERM sorting domain-containing protein [Candidatus Thiodiazotropha sp.]